MCVNRKEVERVRHFKEPARGYCPYLKRDHTIIIEYAEILLAGGQPPGEKTVGFSCDYSEKCGRKTTCPVNEDELEERRQR
jgi:hypothetical protein